MYQWQGSLLLILQEWKNNPISNKSTEKNVNKGENALSIVKIKVVTLEWSDSRDAMVTTSSFAEVAAAASV